VSEDANLFAQQESNRRRSTWLVIGFIVFFAWVGFGGDLAFGLLTADAEPGSYHHVFPVIGLFTTLVAAGICWYSWRFGPRQVLWSTGAREIVDPDTPQERQLVNVVEEMAIASGVPRPRIYLVPDDDPNAFATGRDAATASIAVTEGLLRTLSRDELQGVVAHEMAHVRNLDVRLMTLLAGMVGAIALMSDGMGRMLRGTRNIRGSGGRNSGGGRGKGGGNPLALVVLALWLLTLVVAPVVSRILAMAVSRKREFLADATGAQFTRNPLALASALEKLEAAASPTRAITRGAAHLCIVDPAPGLLSSREGVLADVLSSHPPIRQRIIRLEGMGYQFAKGHGEPPAGGIPGGASGAPSGVSVAPGGVAVAPNGASGRPGEPPTVIPSEARDLAGPRSNPG
jgi:heat shock protein HtpX